MFGSKGNTAPQTSAEKAPVTRSHVAAGLSVTGDMEGDIDLLLDGKLEGNLRCRSVTIGKTGELIGKITAQEVVIDGTVTGNVEAKIVRLNVTAVMSGDVRHEVVEVAAGARIEGRYSRIVEKPDTNKARGKDTQPAPHVVAKTETASEAVAKAEKPTGEVVAIENAAKVG